MNPKDLVPLQAMALEQNPLGVLLLTADAKLCLYANDAARELLGLMDLESFRVENLHGDRQKDGHLAFHTSLLKQNGGYLNVLVKTLEKRWVIVNLTVRHVSLDENGYVLASFQDLTMQLKMQRDLEEREKEIRSAFQELLKQNEQLKALDKAKDRFIGLITHELRTPLASVNVTLDFIKQGFYSSEDELKELVKTAAEQGLHLGRLVNDILDFSKLKADKMDFYLGEHGLKEPIHQSIVTFEKLAQAGEVSFQIDESVEQSPACYFDEFRIRQVFDNVISNAIKFNKKNGFIKIRAQWDDGFVRLYIADTGKGIAEEDLPRIFDEFETLGQLSKHQQGTGLGMPISRRLLQGMGGRISVTSQVGQGTEFCLELPRQKVMSPELYRERPFEDELLDRAS